MTELLKLAMCLVMVAGDVRFNPVAVVRLIREQLFKKPLDSLKVDSLLHVCCLPCAVTPTHFPSIYLSFIYLSISVCLSVYNNQTKKIKIKSGVCSGYIHVEPNIRISAYNMNGFRAHSALEVKRFADISELEEVKSSEDIRGEVDPDICRRIRII